MAQSTHCPFCDHDIFIDEECVLCKSEYDKLDDNQSYLTKLCDITYYVYQCPNCHNVFINEHVSYDGQHFQLESTYPTPQRQISFDKRIEDMSPYFVKVYNQSLCAELNQLSEVTGLGFRKSFEILVKDYAIYLNRDISSQEILKLSLKQTIDKYFKDSEFEPIFRKISWLGNDHSHTFNKHENYNVSDLKRFINSCLSKIISQLDIAELDNIESKNK